MHVIVPCMQRIAATRAGRFAAEPWSPTHCPLRFVPMRACAMITVTIRRWMVDGWKKVKGGKMKIY
jgi:hypothetical protein